LEVGVAVSQLGVYFLDLVRRILGEYFLRILVQIECAPPELTNEGLLVFQSLNDACRFQLGILFVEVGI